MIPKSRPSPFLTAHGLVLLPLFSTLLGIDACPSSDADGDGWSVEEGDCNDDDPQIHPEAAETCDGIDSNCDGETEFATSQPYYPDRDGDGFGSDAEPACQPIEGYLQVRGDCNDADAQVHPAAADVDRDGIDQDCGGADGPQPSVGLEGSSLTSIAAALGQALPGQTVWVGPGTYLELELSFRGRGLTLASTHGAASTVIDARSGGPVFRFEDGETSGTVLSGFTLTGAAGTYGGALSISGSSPSISDCILTGNLATMGGGIYVEDGSPRLTRCSILRNQARYGGGIYMGSQGLATSPVLTGCAVSDNTSAGPGGGIYASYAFPSLAYSVLSGNRSVSFGGGLYLKDGDATLSSSTLVGNSATEGGGIYLAGSAKADILNSILAHNFGYNLYDNSSSPGSSSITYTDLYSVGSLNTWPPVEESSNLEVDPGFVAWTHDGDASNDDLHLRPDSPLRDAGAPSTQDPDGSAADLGAYGGPGAEFGYYLDDDTDGLYDGWERRQGLDVTIDDAAADPDADGLDNRLEFEAATRPQAADSDSDGASDGEERTAGSDPNDWYARPGDPVVVARVPEDFASIQAAVDAVGTTGRIEVAAGTWPETVWIDGREVRLAGSAEGATVIRAAFGPAMSAVEATLELEALTLTAGQADLGGGLKLAYTDGTLADLRVVENVGYGLSLFHASPAITGSSFTGNSLAGIYMYDSQPTLTGCTISDNADSGVYLEAASPTLANCRISDNYSYTSGGGVYMTGSSLVLHHCLLSGNRANAGGGLYTTGSNVSIAYTLWADNSATGQGGGLFLDDSSAMITQSVLYDNSAEGQGGGIYLSSSSPSPELRHLILAYNSGYNFFTAGPAPVLTWSDLYSPAEQPNHNLSGLDASNLSVEPGFLSYDAEGLPADAHLASSSVLVNAGDPAGTDVDGSRTDLGVFGGASGAGWDLDGDGYPNYFWPGSIQAAPSGFEAAAYDVDDLDPGRH